MLGDTLEVQTSSGPLPARFYRAAPSRAALVLAHGAGAGQDHPWMRARAADLSSRGISVLTFDFPYKAQRRRLPDRAPILIAAFRDVVAEAARLAPGPLLIGGKSMGGRMATMLAAEPGLPRDVMGVVAMGYPLHPPGKPEQLRVAHLPLMQVPLLVIQGTRDSFGSPSEVVEACRHVGASPVVVAVEHGGHGFEVPKRAGDQDAVFRLVADEVVRWLDTLLSASEQ
jgi:predicted alpha/beta-hydrolase family hydrolase